MNDVLANIVEETRASLHRNRHDADAIERRAREVASSSEAHRFRRGLRDGHRPVRIIAEIKSASPSAGTIVVAPEVAAIAAEYAAGGAAAISIVTEPAFFHGSLDWIRVASEASSLPVLMKDFVLEPMQIHRGVAAGADAILLIAAILEHERLRDLIRLTRELGRDPLVEVHDARELGTALDAGADIIGVNNRNLRDFHVDLATSESLSASIPPEVLKISESGIRTAEDIRRLLACSYDAFLVGESLLRAPDRREAVEALVGGVVA